MNGWKARGVSLMLALAMLLTMTPTVAFAADNRTATTVTLSTSNSNTSGNVPEGTEITLTAAVKDNSSNVVTEGTVTIYADSVPVGTIPAGAKDSHKLTYTMPAYTDTSQKVVFTAEYSGSTNYQPSSDEVRKKVTPNTLVGAGVTLTAGDNGLTVGQSAALSLSGAVTNHAGETVDAANYTVTYYVSEDNGATWTQLDSETVTPSKGTELYKAVVTPKGDPYTQGAFETAPIGNVTAAKTTVTITAPDTTIYEGQAVTYTATVTTESQTVTGGTVTFYEYLSRDSNPTFVATVPVVNGTARADVVFPEAGEHHVKAVYSGNSAYESSTAWLGEQSVQSTTLEGEADISAAELKLNESNTLTLTFSENYTLGTDYLVIWQQNDGSGWVEFARTESGSDMTTTVTPANTGMRYRALLLPMGSYTGPSNGILSNVLATSESTLLETETVLTATPENVYEDGTVTLTAAVTSGDDKVTGGTVTFTLADDTTKTVALDLTGTATLTVAAYTASGKKTLTYTAKYDGDGVLYAASSETSAKVTNHSTTLVQDGYFILSDDGDYTPEARKKAKLSLPAIYEQGNGREVAMTYGTDYVTEWYVSTDGSTWQSLGSGEKKNVTPAANTDRYKAVVRPVGNYKNPAEGLTFTSKTGTLETTSITLEQAPTGTVYVGGSVTVTASVKDAANTAVTDGTVYFYNAATGALLGQQTLNAQGQAAYTFTATGSDPVSIQAAYSGTGAYAACATTETLKITPQAPEISTQSTQFAVTGDTTSEGKLKVGTTYTLTLPAVYDKDDSTRELEVNTHYTVTWLSRNADGSWSEIAATDSDPASITVTPDHDNAAYTAVIKPNYNTAIGSYYARPVNGISMETLTVGEKQDTALILTADKETQYEGQTVKLTATVTSGGQKVEGGSVTFYHNGEAIGTVTVVNGTASLEVTMPAWVDAAGNTQSYNVSYSGTNAYKAVSRSADTKQQVLVKSATLTVKLGAVITIKDGSDTVTPNKAVVGTSYTLEAPAVYAKSDSKTPLTLGTDYTLEWQYSENGVTWETVSGTEATLDNAKFGNQNAAYRVIIRPAAGGNYTMPSSLVVELKPAAAAEATSTTLTAHPEEAFEGSTITLTATVTAADGGFATGTVKFYQYVDGSDGDVCLGYADLTSQGEALLQVTAPASTGSSSVTYYAVYQGNTIYEKSGSASENETDSWVAQVTLKTAKITSASTRITVKQNGNKVNSGTALTVGQTYTLTIPTIYPYGGTTADKLTVGKDYTVTWQVSTDGGATWNDLGSYAGNSITVTPDTRNSSYQAVVAPAGDYTGAMNGETEVSYLVMTAVNSQRVSTTTTLTADPTACKEGETVTLTAQVTDDNRSTVTSGVVSIYRYQDGTLTADTLVGQKALDATGVVTVTTAAPDYDQTSSSVIYYAKYEGTDSYEASGATSPLTTLTGNESYAATVAVSSNKIVTKGNSTTLTVDPKADKLTVNTPYTLTIPAVYQQGADQTKDENKLTCGTDYQVQWQVSYDNGETWNGLENTGDSIQVTPKESNARYKAVITPEGAYKKAYDGEKTVDSLTMTTDASQVVGTVTTLTVSNTAGKEGGTETQYEGETVTLTATVTENTTGTAKVTSGYVYFYQDGEQIGSVPVDVKDGVASIQVAMTAYDAAETKENNKNVYTAQFMANDSYDASKDSTGVTVLIRSTKIAVPVISSSVKDENSQTETTATTGLTGLPAGTPITFTAGKTVTALDGRTLTAGTDYTWQWQQNSNQGMFVDIGGATGEKYNITSGETGDSFRLTLVPTGHMTAGATSMAATVGTLADATVKLTATEPYKAGNGAHYGDKVTLTATVSGTNATPTGYVTFWYKTSSDQEVQLGQPVALTAKALEKNTAQASIDTTALPQDTLTLFVKYHGDETFAPEDAAGSITAGAKVTNYQVWSVEIDNTRKSAPDRKLTITASADGSDVTGPLTAGKTYTLTLTTPIYTEDGQELAAGEYEILWQQSENGTDWTKVSGAANQDTCTVTPANSSLRYRAQVTTTTNLFAEPLSTTPTRLDTEVSNVISANEQTVTVRLSTDKSELTGAYKDAVYAGNEITIYAEVTPTVTGSTPAPTGKVQFFYAAAGANGTYGTTLTPIPSSDAKDQNSNEASIVERNGKYYAAITTTALPAASDNKQQTVAIVATYLGDGTYQKQTTATTGANEETAAFGVTVYSSTLFASDDVQNQVIDTPSQSTAGVIIYAPEDTLVSDGTATVLTLKPLYTLDAADSGNSALKDSPGEYTNLTETTHYTITWQYTTALTEDPANSSWRDLDTHSATAVVEPQAGYAYRAKITVVTTAERTKKSVQTYYSNILKAAEANAELQLRATPASSGGFSDTDLTFDAYVSGGTSVPAGEITLTIRDSDGETVLTRTATAVNGHVCFGGSQDTAGNINLPAGVYTVAASYTGNSGYETRTASTQYIVRYKASETKVTVRQEAYAALTYDGTMQRPDEATVTFKGTTGHTAAQTKADASVVFQYERKSGDSWVPVDAPVDAGTYRVTAVLPESIYYEAQTSEAYAFTVAQKEIRVSDLLVQAKVYDGKTDASLLDVQLTGVVAGDSVYTVGTTEIKTADALVNNTVTYTAAEIKGADGANYKFASGGNTCTEAFTIARNVLTVDSSKLNDSPTTGLAGLIVYDNYGTELAKDTGYTVRYFFHDGSGVKATTDLTKAGKYTVIVAPKDSANYKGGETVIMTVAEDKSVSFATSGAFAIDSAAPAKPGVITFSSTQQDYSAGGNAVTAAASNGAEVTVAYSSTVDGQGRYGVTATAAGCEETHGILSVYRIEGPHIAPVVEDKTYDGSPVTVKNSDRYAEGTYFTYTGGEIIGVSYDAPKDAGTYTVTAHVPATTATVAYTETSTFIISRKEITVSAVGVTKQVYRTNPALRAVVTGLVEGDSDRKDFLVQPSFTLDVTEGVNSDLNQVGTYTIVPSGVVSRNYVVTPYQNGTFAVQQTDPAQTMTIVGLPNGGVYYGDSFTVSLYGTVANRVDGYGSYNNPSSVINWYVTDTKPVDENGKLTADLASELTSAYAEIDANGGITTEGKAGAGSFYILATRGTGDYKTFVYQEVTVSKRPVSISMTGEDSKVYNGADQSVDTTMYTVSGLLGTDSVTPTFDPKAGKDVGDYLIRVSVNDNKYTGSGKGLMTITQKSATVTTANQTKVYGEAVADNLTYGDDAVDGDTLLTEAKTMTDLRSSSDVGSYEIFTAGVENANYDVTYRSGTYTVTAKALTAAKAGVDAAAENNKITDQVKREYGTVNPQMGYEIDGLIDGDSLADLLIADAFVTYARAQEDSANLSGDDNTQTVKGTKFVNGHTGDDGYGLIDLADTLANSSENAKNYTITPTDGLLDIYQKNVTVTVQDLKVVSGTNLTDDSYTSIVNRVLTEAPMNDVLADLGLTYSPTGVVTTGGDITVTLKTGTKDDPQNYYRTNPEQKGTLTVAKAANAAITADKSSVSVTTTDGETNQPVNVGDIAYVVLDAGGSQVASGTMAAGTTVGQYGDNPYDTIQGGLSALPSGSYTIVLTAASDGYALQPTSKTFTVAGSSSGGGGGGGSSSGGGGGSSTPSLIKDDHFAYMQGNTLGNFRPDANMTRAEAATVFYNLLSDKTAGSTTVHFTDVADDGWYATAINTLASLGIINGYTDGTFRPNANVTRAEFAAIASRFDDLSSGETTFSDVSADSWAYKYIVSAATKGWITGYSDGTFRPNQNITRCEVVTLVNRVLERTPDETFIDKNLDSLRLFPDVASTHWAYYNIIEATNSHDFVTNNKTETWKTVK